MESIKILLPEAVTIVENALQQHSDLLERLNEDEVEKLRDESVFPTLNKEILQLIIFDEYATSVIIQEKIQVMRVLIHSVAAFCLVQILK